MNGKAKATIAACTPRSKGERKTDAGSGERTTVVGMTTVEVS